MVHGQFFRKSECTRGNFSEGQSATPVYCVSYCFVQTWIKCQVLKGQSKGDPVGQECRAIVFVHIKVCHNSLHQLHAWIYNTYTRVHVGTHTKKGI